MTLVRSLVAIAALLFATVHPRLLHAQSDTVRAALALRDSAKFANAAALLRTYLAAHPSNGDAARLLSETLYWAHDVGGARAVADSALALHPEDTALRLQYGAMLVDLGDANRARQVLAPVLETPERGRATALLGRLAYWSGDLTRARALLKESLGDAPGTPDVRRQLGEILELSAPWIGGGASLRHDDQPITSVAFNAEAGWFPTPLTRVAARVEPIFFRLADTATASTASAELSVSNYWPAAHLDGEIAAGGLERSFGSATDWFGRAALGLRLPEHVTLGVRGERAPYFYTEASLSSPVMTTTATALLHLDSPRGWMGEAALANQRFPDANNVATAYVWLLAPVVHSSTGDLRLGYSGVLQNADESRFVLARSVQRVPPVSPGLDLSGRYEPYYTPDHLASHSVVAAASGRVSPLVTLHANGAYALHATDHATTFEAVGGPSPQQAGIVRVVSPRGFTPWNARASIDVAGATGLTVSTGGELTRSAFYTAAMLDIRATYRFGVAVRRAAAGF